MIPMRIFADPLYFRQLAKTIPGRNVMRDTISTYFVGSLGQIRTLKNVSSLKGWNVQPTITPRTVMSTMNHQRVKMRSNDSQGENSWLVIVIH
jgi:hypothetical protein